MWSKDSMGTACKGALLHANGAGWMAVWAQKNLAAQGRQMTCDRVQQQSAVGAGVPGGVVVTACLVLGALGALRGAVVTACLVLGALGALHGAVVTG